MKKIILAITMLISPLAFAQEKAKATKPADSPIWTNVDKELESGAKKIGTMLEKNGVDTKAAPAKTPETPEPTPAAAPAPVAAEGGLTKKANSAWASLVNTFNSLLGKSSKTEEAAKP